jgi:hypothetical protein
MKFETGVENRIAMKKNGMSFVASILFVVCTAFQGPGVGSAPSPDSAVVYPKVENKAFRAGELLKFRVHYGIIDAGTAQLEVTKPDRKIAGRELLHVVGTGRSKGAFDWFFKVRDRYESYLDEEGVFPWLFIRRIEEGGYSKSQDYKFFQNKQKVLTNKGKTFDVPIGVQDMLSAFYYARTMDFTGLQAGDTVTVTSFIDDEVYPLRIKYVGKEVVKIRSGSYRCMKFNTIVQEGRVFKANEDLAVYISDDENKIPILGEVKILVGSIKVELTEYKGLANPLSKVDD